jgi:23S rRNA (adenine-N6)-dimethyltransferase
VLLIEEVTRCLPHRLFKIGLRIKSHELPGSAAFLCLPRALHLERMVFMSSALRDSLASSQNFLKDPRLVAALIERCQIGCADLVYEIGAGKGIITAQLARRCQRVIAIEKDPRLAALLRQRFAGWDNVTLYEGDVLDADLPRQPYKVFANIPFHITAAIVTKLTTAAHPPEEAYLAMQQEAAEMWLGEPRESLRTVLLKPWFEVALVHRFRRADFVPVPQVDVVMLRLRKRGPPLVSRQQKQGFRDFVVHVFTNWQPTLGSSLKMLFTGPQLKHISKEVGFESDATPTVLSFEQWLSLFAYFEKLGNAQAKQGIAGSERRLKGQQQKLQKARRTRKRTRG